MGFGDLQFYDIIIFAGIALFLVYRLKNVLGRRTGFEKNITNKISTEDDKSKETTEQKNIPELNDNIAELSKAYEILDNFDHKNFIDGAKLAFETIINSFNKGDKKALKRLLTKEVYLVFEKEINNNNIDLNSQLFSLNIEKIDSVVVKDGIIKIGIKFISEHFKNNDETTITKKQDVWTFEKPTNSKDPNWLLSST